MSTMKLPKDAWAISPENTALVVIDMQRAFVGEESPRACPGSMEFVPKINELSAMCRKVGLPVIYIKDVRKTDLSDSGLMEDFFPKHPGDEMEPFEGKKGSEFCLGLDVHSDDHIVHKTRWSAFIRGSSNLESLLGSLGRDSMIVCGVITDVCVGTTVIDAMMLGFKVFLVGDLTATRSEERQKIALELYNQRFAKVMTFGEVMKELAQLAETKL
jgi:ureidoacrylate peracid hydrolase